jgi:hypothetical protein
MLEDPLVTGPNVVSCLSSGLCLWLKYYKFPASEARDGDGEELPLASAGKGKLMEPSCRAFAASAGKGKFMEPSCRAFAAKEMTSFVAKGEIACAGRADAGASEAEPDEEAPCAGGTGGTC